MAHVFDGDTLLSIVDHFVLVESGFVSPLGRDGEVVQVREQLFLFRDRAGKRSVNHASRKVDGARELGLCERVQPHRLHK